MRVVAIFRVFAKMAQTFRHLLYLSQVLESRESGASPDMVRLSTYRRLSPANFVTLQGCYLPGK
jgi:hypothetical protein